MSSIITSVITGFLILTASLFCLGFLLIAMNGFSERQAMPVFIGLVVVSFVCVLAFGLFGVWIKNRIAKKKETWHIALSSFLAVVIASISGIVVSCGVSFLILVIASQLI